MTLGLFLQYLYLFMSCGIIVSTLPGAYRLITGKKPLRPFDPLKLSFLLVAVCIINSFSLRFGELHDSDSIALLASRGLSTLSITATAVVMFITEKVVLRARES